MISMKLYPVALFVYNRLETLVEVIDGLKACPESSFTDLYVFSDAPRFTYHEKQVETVRRYLKTIDGFLSVNIIERSENYYIERNIIDGVSLLLEQYEALIILEDDGIPHIQFLAFMNDVLSKYRYNEKIMHVGAFTFIEPELDNWDVFFWQYVENTGGWGTWSRAWDNFKYFDNKNDLINSLSDKNRSKLQIAPGVIFLDSANLTPIPWVICWFCSMIREDGISVQSRRTLLKNNGLYNGVHFTPINRLLGKSAFEVDFLTDAYIGKLPETIDVNPKNIDLLGFFYQRLETGRRKKMWAIFLKFIVHLKITRSLRLIRDMFLYK